MPASSRREIPGTRIPGLVVRGCVDATARVRDGSGPDVEVCRDARGDLLAYCRDDGRGLRVDMPDLASFYYRRGARRVTAVPHRPLARGFVIDTYHHCVLPLLLPALGTEVLHASAVGRGDGVAAFCGESGAGKSTIAVALARRGYAIWADDAVAVDVTPSQPAAVPLPFAVRLRVDSAEFFGKTNGHGAAATAASDRAPTRLAVLCLLRRAGDAAPPVTVARLDAASACQAALAHAYCFSATDRDQKRRMIGNYLTLAARVPAYEIVFAPGLDRLHLVLDAIEHVIDSASTRTG